VIEAEWLKTSDPSRLLQFVMTRHGPLNDQLRLQKLRIRDRKLRLYACACCRRFIDLLTDERCRKALEVAERYADGLAGQGEREAALMAAVPVFVRLTGRASAAAQAACITCLHDPAKAADSIAGVSGTAAGATKADFRAFRCRLLRCLFGNPFRPLPAVDPSWLAWNGGTVAKLAQTIYEERRFADLPILADALEEAGCADATIMTHCRTQMEHVRGCWVVDLLTGRE